LRQNTWWHQFGDIALLANKTNEEEDSDSFLSTQQVRKSSRNFEITMPEIALFRNMSTAPFLVGLVVSTVNVAFLLRHIKYRTELCTYGYLEGNQPFSSKTPFTDSKDYRLVRGRRELIHL
jgi:hypothetical protein